MIPMIEMQHRSSLLERRRKRRKRNRQLRLQMLFASLLKALGDHMFLIIHCIKYSYYVGIYSDFYSIYRGMGREGQAL